MPQSHELHLWTRQTRTTTSAGWYSISLCSFLEPDFDFAGPDFAVLVLPIAPQLDTHTTSRRLAVALASAPWWTNKRPVVAKLPYTIYTHTQTPLPQTQAHGYHPRLLQTLTLTLTLNYPPLLSPITCASQSRSPPFARRSALWPRRMTATIVPADWCSGIIQTILRSDPGSNPGRRNNLPFFLSSVGRALS